MPSASAGGVHTAKALITKLAFYADNTKLVDAEVVLSLFYALPCISSLSCLQGQLLSQGPSQTVEGHVGLSIVAVPPLQLLLQMAWCWNVS